MLEALLLLTGIGLLLSSRQRMGPANPFQLYFSVWFFVFLGYYATRETFIAPQPTFFFSIFVSITVAFVFLVATSLQREARRHVAPSIDSIRISKKSFIAAQLATSLALAPIFIRAQTLSGGESVFTALGYIALRSAMTNEGKGFGVLSYFFPLAFVLTSLSLILYQQKRTGIFPLSISLTTGLFYAYLSTGRTFILLLFCLSIFPLLVTRTIRVKSLLLYSPILFLAFAFVALMTGKGVSTNAGITENIQSFANSLRSYTIAPLLALSEIISHGFESDFGKNSLRFFFSTFYAVGLTDTPPMPLIRDYVNTPDPTNVYTVYEVYIRDFSTAGLFIPPALLFAHQFLYQKASRSGGAWILYYSASTYPLLMQFFQDQYFSLTSLWIQIAFWYFFLSGTRRSTSRGELKDA